MSFRLMRVMIALVMLASLTCASCLTIGVPKSAKVESAPPTSGSSKSGASDGRLVDSWELMYQVNDRGEEERPREKTRTLIQFTGEGRVVFNRIDGENSDHKKSRTGKYSLDKDEISITDDAGNSVKWSYTITGDTLVIVMPEVKKKFYWRRSR